MVGWWEGEGGGRGGSKGRETDGCEGGGAEKGGGWDGHGEVNGCEGGTDAPREGGKGRGGGREGRTAVREEGRENEGGRAGRKGREVDSPEAGPAGGHGSGTGGLIQPAHSACPCFHPELLTRLRSLSSRPRPPHLIPRCTPTAARASRSRRAASFSRSCPPTPWCTTS